ncbi:MAG: hypothetical protein HXY51_09160 [Nitrospirae bacterium]|nr:hypothetical protein [Nitrospirota bacterium]
MSEHDLEKLLGGFAADTLTPEERQALYAAALQDQQLFNALADEQALKEVLSNPDIRLRLLASLAQKKASDTPNPLSWLDWFRRPAGIAFAGGLTAAALAVVLGVRIFQDSLKQATQSVETEVAKPASPPVPAAPASQPPSANTTEPQMKTKEAAGPSKDMGTKDGPLDRATKREQPVPPASQEQKAEVTSAADQKLAATSAQPAATLESNSIGAQAGLATGLAAPTFSARALFYAGESPRPDTSVMARENERTMKPLAETAPHANRLERKLEGVSQLGKAAGTVAQPRPLGLRYSFVVREADGQEREVDVAIAPTDIQLLFLTLEANQDAYLQIWKTVGSSTPQLQLPEKGTGQLSLKMTAGQRQYIHLPMDREPTTLTARLSLVPFGPITRKGTAWFDRSSLHQLQESITELNQTESPERATYVVNQNSSTTAQITVDIILGR